MLYKDALIIQLWIQQFIFLIGSDRFFSMHNTANSYIADFKLPEKCQNWKYGIKSSSRQNFQTPSCTLLRVGNYGCRIQKFHLIAKFSFTYIWNRVPRGTQSKSKLHVQTLLPGEFRSFVCTAVQIYLTHSPTNLCSDLQSFTCRFNFVAVLLHCFPLE